MHREHHRWYSWRLDRHMDLLVFGHAGAKVLVFPTSKGKFYEWEDRGMMNALAHKINNGWFQLYCVDSVDAESWYNWWVHPGARAYRHHQYFEYLYHEVLPFMASKNSNPYLITTGASFGAFHAMSFGLKYPGTVKRILGMSGFYNILSFTGGYGDDYVYFNNPMSFIPNENDGFRLHLMREMDIIMVAGKSDRLLSESLNMSRVLWEKGIGNALREWDGWAHDWPYWYNMINLYLGGHD